MSKVCKESISASKRISKGLSYYFGKTFYDFSIQLQVQSQHLKHLIKPSLANVTFYTS